MNRQTWVGTGEICCSQVQFAGLPSIFTVIAGCWLLVAGCWFLVAVWAVVQGFR